MNYYFSVFKKNFLFFTFILFFSLAFVAQYRFPSSDQFEQLPVIQSLTSPELFHNDWYVQHSNLSVRFIYMKIVAIIASVTNIKFTFAFLYLISGITTAVGIYFVTFEIFKKKEVGIVTSMVILLGLLPSLGASALFFPMVVSTNLVVPLTLFSFYFLLKKKYILSAVILGFATLVHILIGPLMAVFMILFIALRPKKTRSTLREYVYSILTYFSVSIFSLYPFLYELFTNKTKLSTETLLHIIAFVRHPWHYLPTQFSLFEYATFVSLTLVFLFFLKFDKNKSLKLTFKIVFLIFAIFMLVGTVFVELFPISIIIKLQLFRMSAYLSFFMLTYIIYNSMVHLEKCINKKRTEILFYSTSILVCVMLFIFHFVKLNTQTTYNFDKNELFSWIINNTETSALLLVPPYIEETRYSTQRAVVIDFKAFPFEDEYMLEWFSRIQDITNFQNFSFRGNRQNELIQGYCSLTTQNIVELSKKYQFNYFLSDSKNCFTLYDFTKVYENNSFILYQLDLGST